MFLPLNSQMSAFCLYKQHDFLSNALTVINQSYIYLARRFRHKPSDLHSNTLSINKRLSLGTFLNKNNDMKKAIDDNQNINEEIGV